jgi:AraC-like DNA-binding protein
LKTSYPQVPARYYARMVEVLQGAGVDVALLLRTARVHPEHIARPEAMLSLDAVERLVVEALRLSGRTDLGLDVGRALKLSSHSIVGYGMLSSPTLDYALRLAARFFRLIMPAFRMRYRVGSEQAELLFEPTVPLSHACLNFHLEVLAVAAHVEASELVQVKLPRYDLYLSYAEPPHVMRYEELDGVRCHFGWMATPGVRMVFPAVFVTLPLALADPAALQMAEARCRALVRHALAGGKVSDWVRMMLRESSGGMPSLTELAHTLNLSPRTLDRYLRREGAGFRELSRKARVEKAGALLRDPGLSVTQAAHELGYTDAANFTRAFRRETGCSPSAYRARRKAG